MSSRDNIFERLAEANRNLPQRTPLPDYDPAIAFLRQTQTFASPWELFCHRWKLVNGQAFDRLTDLADWMSTVALRTGYCDPRWIATFQQLCPTIVFVDNFDRARCDDYEFGITIADGAIASTGTVILKDRTTSSRLAALAPWTHIALLSRRQIYLDFHAAVTDLGDDPAVIFVTGPSKTADVEGILIEGVHGPGRQLCVLVE